ncbi:polysaccharide deacetylase family protein [Sphaerisporangium corydalis]|uniref:Polysaccharide deacetylase family protein n=1 Tax=Sphaerisporangium corydalis TaxID=1441875 RepID=A0ABV9EM64_9ACTN|nr:polysaccharide deacetylase family protein [Sphaerisporangium corydalis]
MAVIRVGFTWLSLPLSFLAVLSLPGCGEVVAPVPQGHDDGVVRVRTSAPVRRQADPVLLARWVIAQQPGWPGTRPVAAPRRRSIKCGQVKCVALTFDDGPFDYTGTVLDILAENHAKATFFIVGQMVTPRTLPFVRRMVSEGHEVGNHSWSHPSLTSLSREALRGQIERTQQVVKAATGATMRLLRPPYGATNGTVAAEAAHDGLAQVLWDLDTLDWRDRNSTLVAKRASAARPGSIVLLHDIHRTTVEAVPRLLRELTAKGYTFVTVSELYGARGLVPGRRYTGEAGEESRRP